jgi:hypothetical protein
MAGMSSEENKKIEGSWLDIELVDVVTQEKFKISDFKGVSVVLETFDAR